VVSVALFFGLIHAEAYLPLEIENH